jgi:hypothetical protein
MTEPVPLENLSELSMIELDDIADTLRECLPDNTCKAQLGLVLYSQMRKKYFYLHCDMLNLCFGLLMPYIEPLISEDSKKEIDEFLNHREYGLALEIVMDETESHSLYGSGGPIDLQINRLRSYMGLSPCKQIF